MNQCRLQTTVEPTISDQAVFDRWLTYAKALGHREDVRYAWAVPMELVVDPDGARSELYHVMARDISRAGLGITSEEPIEPGTRVRLRLAETDSRVELVVKHCTASAGCYKIGLAISGVPPSEIAPA